jgi:hypothetical protein
MLWFSFFAYRLPFFAFCSDQLLGEVADRVDLAEQHIIGGGSAGGKAGIATMRGRFATVSSVEKYPSWIATYGSSYFFSADRTADRSARLRSG